MHFLLDPRGDCVRPSPPSELQYHYRTAHQLLEAKKTIDRGYPRASLQKQIPTVLWLPLNRLSYLPIILLHFLNPQEEKKQKRELKGS